MSYRFDFSRKPVIACIHLLSTPGSPLYCGHIERVYEMALADARVFSKYNVDGIIVENFRDGPFYPDTLPAETVATLAGVTREIIARTNVPIGVAALRNDGEAAMAIAAAVNAHFVRINVHIGAVLSEQGLILGKAYKTLRLRQNLRCEVSIFADAAVKHSTPLAYPELAHEVCDISSSADAVIVSGIRTGVETIMNDLATAKQNTNKPVIIGSGVTPDNIEQYYSSADGFIVGSFFKEAGKAHNSVEEARVKIFMNKLRTLRN